MEVETKKSLNSERLFRFFFLFACEDFLDEAATPFKNDATRTFLDIAVNIENKINECKLQLFPISEEMSLLVSFARF